MKTTFTTLCKGRRWQLESTLPRNLVALSGHQAQCLVVDFHSSDGLAEWVQEAFYEELHDGRLIFAQLLTPVPFSIPVGKNFGHRLAPGDFIMNLDADNYVANALDAIKNLSTSQFMWSSEMGIGVYGRIGAWRAQLVACGGYDESFLGAGYQDTDLVRRLEGLGAQAVNVRCAVPAIQNSKNETLKNLGGGGRSQWDVMNETNGLKSVANLQAGRLEANASALTEAVFRINFQQEVSLTRDRYFLKASVGL